ncbi:hypothetical protein CLUG_03984 [Clavispora lusitaniae ATCC 42720]|uniref:Cytochrome P450 n=1 Tax=Clavispora lusitaniae (strain ATCC 42720) TaxID=306902 RepID=C4Y750_CLAL4|nr:uncharacterized protein CLUG_03984 [Clavispora lusitaniae ATCC 42720]EEQ39856.1 hypothetical protein CLUG_03984 [Clavispora lusitaniae ATCC 42720]
MSLHGVFGGMSIWSSVLLFIGIYLAGSYIRRYIAYKRSGAMWPAYGTDKCLGFKVVREMLKMRQIGRAPDFFQSKFEITGVYTGGLLVGGRYAITTRDPENVKAILATQFNDFNLGNRNQHIKVTLGDGIFTLDGAGWKSSRAMLRPQFAREQIAHVQSLERHVQRLAQKVRGTKGERFDIQPLFAKLTIDSGTEFLFGESCESLVDGESESETGLDPALKAVFAEAFNYTQTILFQRLSLQKLYFLVDGFKFRRQNRIVHQVTDFFVERALHASDKEAHSSSRGGYVFLYELMKQTRDPKVLRDQCLNVLLAARDTTSGLLSFCFFELARNPAVFARLREEISFHFGLGESADLSAISFESLKKCEYLRAVLHETLRMYPSVPANFRVATRDTTLPHGGGPDESKPIFVPKGTMCIYQVYSVHRSEVHYGKDYNDFRPERWFEERTKKLGWAFLPFNGGPRICLGQQFALTEASYVIVRLLQMFEHIESFDSVYPPAKATHLTMSLFDGANIALW